MGRYIFTGFLVACIISYFASRALIPHHHYLWVSLTGDGGERTLCDTTDGRNFSCENGLALYSRVSLLGNDGNFRLPTVPKIIRTDDTVSNI
jgi:hypothetical protein